MRLLPPIVRRLQTTTLLALLAANVRAETESPRTAPIFLPAPTTSPITTSPTDEAPVPVQGKGAIAAPESDPPSPQHEGESAQAGVQSAVGKGNDPALAEAARGLVVSPRDLDRILRDAASDLGLQVQRMRPASFAKGLNHIEWEAELGVPAAGKVNIGAIVEHTQGQWSVRVALALPDGTLRSVRTLVTKSDYEVPVIKALRQLAADVQSSPLPDRDSPVAPAKAFLEPPSDGRAILAANGALLGGYVGFTLENAGGAAEARLVYPLIALGAGVGLASSLIVAEEWDVSRAEAWYVSAASAWLTGSAILISSEFDLTHATDRYSYGLVGTAAGLGMAGIVTTQREVSDAESLFAHSGGLLGMVIGGLTQRLIDPDTDRLPRLGMGVGSSAGLLIAGLGGSALLPSLTSSRVLFADLGGLLGGLAGAAVASPVLVGKDPADTREARIFVGAALGGLTLGTVIGYWLGPDTTTNLYSSQFGLIKPVLAPVTAVVPPAAFSLEPELPQATTLGLHGRW